MGNHRLTLQKIVCHFFALFFLVFCLANEVKAKEKNLTVDVEITAPCVMHHNGTYTGFDIELWEEIARELELTFTYNETNLKGRVPRPEYRQSVNTTLNLGDSYSGCSSTASVVSPSNRFLK